MKLKVNGEEIEIEALQSIELADDEYLFIKVPDIMLNGHTWANHFFGDKSNQVCLHHDDLEFAKVRFAKEKNLS